MARKNAKERLKKRDNKVTETAGIEADLRLCEGARVMLRRNINVGIGLVNGAIGLVQEIKRDVRGNVDHLNIKFDNIPEVQKLGRSKVKFELCDQLYVVRAQFPLILSYSMTIHKSQGLSLPQAIVDVGNSIFGDGMTYVALSRVESLSGLHLMNFDPSKANPNKICIQEINRLRSINKPSIAPLILERKKLKWIADRVWCPLAQMPLQSKENIAPKTKKTQGKRKREPVQRDIAPTTKRIRTYNVELQKDKSKLVVQWPKFDNQRSKVACYSNSAFQALFAVKNFETACSSFANGATELKKEVFELVRLHQSRKVRGGQRLFTVSIRNTLGRPFTNADGHQCAFEFIRRLLDALDLRQLFKISFKVLFHCLTCDYKEMGENDTLGFLQVNVNHSRDFHSMLRQWMPVEGRKCTGCGDQNFIQSINEIEETKDQVIIYISRHTGGEDVFDNRPIANFNPDRVSICHKELKTVSAILHYGEVNRGHYVAIVRSPKYGWLLCDDHVISILQSFPNELCNVSLLFLE